jgi:hypothetical protein
MTELSSQNTLLSISVAEMQKREGTKKAEEDKIKAENGQLRMMTEQIRGENMRLRHEQVPPTPLPPGPSRHPLSAVRRGRAPFSTSFDHEAAGALTQPRREQHFMEQVSDKLARFKVPPPPPTHPRTHARAHNNNTHAHTPPSPCFCPPSRLTQPRRRAGRSAAPAPLALTTRRAHAPANRNKAIRCI